MGVGADHQLHARLSRHRDVQVVQVEALGLGVDLEQHAVVAGRRDDLGHVHGIGLATAEQPAGRVPQHVHARMRQRPHDPACHLRASG
jgi:hypothetical protein